MNVSGMTTGLKVGAVVAGGVAAFGAVGAATGALAKHGRDIEPEGAKVPAGIAMYLGGAASVTATAVGGAMTGAVLRDVARGARPVGGGLAAAAAGAAVMLAAPVAGYAAFKLS